MQLCALSASVTHSTKASAEHASLIVWPHWPKNTACLLISYCVPL